MSSFLPKNRPNHGWALPTPSGLAPQWICIQIVCNEWRLIYVPYLGEEDSATDAIDEARSEILSDIYTVSEIDDIVYEVNCPVAPRSSYTVGKEDEEDEEDENDEEKSKLSNAVINYFKLDRINMDRHTYVRDMKNYAVRVRNYLASQGSSQQEISDFKRNFQAYFKDKILPNFNDFEFYAVNNYIYYGMIILLNHREDGTPYLIYWKHGLEAMHC
ncbi:Mss4-like protein [Aspergillus parasiticus]|uniref:Translationally-controlled tumor protein homolog n=1 Tax=Aspergillus parasiticus TaxID=5067 RepID=A0A5N6DQC1_ASPPA|nr:Mss4-like protein [Aspergillus parasiticus]